MMTHSEQIISTSNRHIMQTYGRLAVALVRGKGARVWDADGKEYLDFFGGLAVDSLGHCHPRVVAAICEQAGRLLHVSNLFYTEPAARLAELLVAQGIGERVFFCNSGAEANEGAIKLARKYHWRRGDHGRYKIVAADHSFHGRTLATLTATGKKAIQEGFGPLPEGFLHVPFNDIAALERAVDETVAAVLLEPVQGEGGVNPAEPAYLQAARRLTQERGALLIFDEVQTGIGRTGHFFAYQGYGVEPDVVTAAKALGGGMPIGCFGARGAAATEALKPGDHATTFGANPVICAAAVAVIETILQADLLAQVRALGDYFMQGLKQLAARHPAAVAAVRGQGLILGLELTFAAAPVLNECLQRGILINVTADNVLRFLPPFVISQSDIDLVLSVLDAAIGNAAGQQVNQ